MAETYLSSIKPLATMEQAWAEYDRLRAEGDQVVILTAQALYGKDFFINWRERTAMKRGDLR